MKPKQEDTRESINGHKIKTKESNKYFKMESFRKIDLIKNKFIVNLKNINLDENIQIEFEQKIVLLMYHFSVLSLCKREEILPLMEQLGIGKGVTNYFVEAEDIFNVLDKFQEKSNFLIEYKPIAPYYLDNINPFFLKQLAEEHALNIKKHLNTISRQQRDGNLDELYNEVFDKRFMAAKNIEQVNPNFKFPVYENNVAGTFKKYFTYHDKIAFRNIYFSLYENNKIAYADNFSEKDFKIFFYDLLEIIVKDKSILTLSIDSQVKYGKLGNNRYKVKWVNSFLKTWE